MGFDGFDGVGVRSCGDPQSVDSAGWKSGGGREVEGNGKDVEDVQDGTNASTTLNAVSRAQFVILCIGRLNHIRNKQ